MKLAFKIFAFQFERALYSGRATKYTEKPNPTPATMLEFYLQKTLQKYEDRFTWNPIQLYAHSLCRYWVRPAHRQATQWTSSPTNYR